MKTSRIVFGLALVLAVAYTATNAQASSSPLPLRISGYYSLGNAKSITYDDLNTLGTTGLSGSGEVHLNPSLLKSRNALLRGWPKAKTFGDRWNAFILGMPWLSTLIHESLHNRVEPGWDNGDEILVGRTAYQLVPDAMRRFFGVRAGSKLDRAFVAAIAKELAPVPCGSPTGCGG